MRKYLTCLFIFIFVFTGCKFRKTKMNQLDYLLVTCEYIKTRPYGTGYIAPYKVDKTMSKILHSYGYADKAYPMCEEEMGGVNLYLWPYEVVKAKTEMTIDWNLGELNCSAYKRKYAHLQNASCGSGKKWFGMPIFSLLEPEYREKWIKLCLKKEREGVQLLLDILKVPSFLRLLEKDLENLLAITLLTGKQKN